MRIVVAKMLGTFDGAYGGLVFSVRRFVEISMGFKAFDSEVRGNSRGPRET
jgi:hypothetical protein